MPILSAGNRRSIRDRAAFTMLELLVVLVVIGLFMALVTPRIGRMPRGLMVKSMLGRIDASFRDAAMRARARGSYVQLVLDPGANCFRIQDSNGMPGSSGAENDGLLGEAGVYAMPAGTEWQMGIGDNESYSFLFFPGGEASGPQVEVVIGEMRFFIGVDCLTGKPVVTEIRE